MSAGDSARARREPGEVLEGFTLHKQLHAGGMATLWQVSHADHPDTPLLMKLPKLAEGEDAAAIVSFEMESMILPRLSGPHVPKVFGVGDFARTPFVVMEHIPGGSLLAWIDRLPRPVEEVARIGARVADGLVSLHSQDVIHLDIKPSNILFRPNGQAVLVDFGLSHHAHLPDLIAEEFRLPYGTAPYMAPEQVIGARTYRRSDIFALGSLMYFFATGTRPFGDPQSLKGLKRRIWEPPTPPRKLNADVAPWLQEIILRCLEVDPDQRFPTAAQLAFALRHPDQVALTGRATRTGGASYFARWSRRAKAEAAAPLKKLAAQSKLATALIIAAAIDLNETAAPVAEAIRVTLLRQLEANDDVRLALLNVLKLKTLAPDATLDGEGRNRHLQLLAELRAWADPMRLPPGRVTFHVLEAVNPAEAILDYARANHVDQIVMGARAESLKRRMLGSVSGEVAAHAPCTVTVVRVREWDGEPSG
jgi:eukaryotic-like serine/threonine-protein kinase